MPIRSKRDYRYYLQADLESYRLVRKIDKGVGHNWREPTLYLQTLLRRLEYYRFKKEHTRFKFLYRLLYKRAFKAFKKQSVHTGISVHPFTIGPGLFLGHYGDVVVHGKAKIGRNCKFAGGVVVGGTKSGVPSIGNNVSLGAGCKVIGGITIGDNVTVGANAVVTKDVESNCVVAGVPAKVLGGRTSMAPNAKRGADKAKAMPLPITKWDRFRMLLGFDQDLKSWPIKK